MSLEGYTIPFTLFVVLASSARFFSLNMTGLHLALLCFPLMLSMLLCPVKMDIVWVCVIMHAAPEFVSLCCRDVRQRVAEGGYVTQTGSNQKAIAANTATAWSEELRKSVPGKAFRWKTKGGAVAKPARDWRKDSVVLPSPSVDIFDVDDTMLRMVQNPCDRAFKSSKCDCDEPCRWASVRNPP